MSVRFSRWNSNIAAQPVTPDIATVAPGSLPVSLQTYIDPPEVVSQGNSFLSQDSIGSAKFETRNFEISTVDPTNELLTGSAPSAKQAGLSPVRPALIGVYDIFGSSLTIPAGGSTFNESMRFSEFEANLSLEDYRYLVNELRTGNATAPIVSAIEAQASSDIASVQEPLANIAKLASVAENFSTQLDVISHWGTLKNDIESFYQSYIANGFDYSPAITGLSELDSSARLSTSFIEGLERSIVNDSQDSIIALLESRIRNEGLFFDDGTIEGYSTLSRMGKASICCTILSRIYGASSVGDARYTSLPLAFGGNRVFESKRVGGLPSNYDSIVRPALSTGSITPLQKFKTEFVTSFSNSVSSITRKSSVVVGGGRYAVDVLQVVLKELVSSFPALSQPQQNPGIVVSKEIGDATVIQMSLKSPTNDPIWCGLIRGTLLTMILDKTINELQLNNAFKGAAIGALLEWAMFSSEFLTEERLKNYPNISREKVRTITRGEFAEYIDPSLKPSVYSSNAPQDTSGTISDAELRNNGFLDKFPGGYDAISARGASGDQALIGTRICGAIDSFARNQSITVARSTERIFETLVSRFGVSGGFIFSSGETASKRMVYSIIFECIANLVSLFVGPGYTSPELVTPPAVEATSQRIAELEEEKAEVKRQIEEYQDTIDRYNNLLRGGGSSTTLRRASEEAEAALPGLRTRLNEINTELASIDAGTGPTAQYKFYRLSVRKSFEKGLRLADKISKATTPGTIKDVIARSNEDKTKRPFEMPLPESGALTNAYRDTRLKISRVSALNAIGKLVDNESSGLIAMFERALATSTIINPSQRQVLFSSLTPEIASQKSSLYDRLVSQGSFTSSAQQNIFDVSATRKLKAIFTSEGFDNLIDNSAIAIIGIPTGFMQNLRQADVTSSRLTRVPKYYAVNSYARKLTDPYLDDVSGPTFLFHPYIDCNIVGEIPASGMASNSVVFSFFNSNEGTWKNLSYVQLLILLAALGISGENDRKNILLFHYLDALCKSAIRTISGIDLKSLSQDNTGFQISSGRATQLLSLLQSARSGLIPNRGLQVNQFLSLSSGGNFEPIPFSRLSDQASSLTTPADHSLLVDFLKSGAFTSSTVSESLFAVSGLERLYCIPLDFDEFTFGGATARESADVQDGTLIAFDIGAAY